MLAQSMAPAAAVLDHRFSFWTRPPRLRQAFVFSPRRVDTPMPILCTRMAAHCTEQNELHQRRPKCYRSTKDTGLPTADISRAHVAPRDLRPRNKRPGFAAARSRQNTISNCARRGSHCGRSVRSRYLHKLPHTAGQPPAHTQTPSPVCPLTHFLSCSHFSFVSSLGHQLPLTGYPEHASEALRAGVLVCVCDLQCVVK